MEHIRTHWYVLHLVLGESMLAFLRFNNGIKIKIQLLCSKILTTAITVTQCKYAGWQQETGLPQTCSFPIPHSNVCS